MVSWNDILGKCKSAVTTLISKFGINHAPTKNELPPKLIVSSETTCPPFRKFLNSKLAAIVVIILIVPPTKSLAEVPAFPHLAPSSYTAPMIPGFYQLTWVGQWQKPPRPEFTDVPNIENSNIQDPGLNWGRFVFPKCSEEIVIRCINSIDYRNQNSSDWKKAAFLRYLPVSTAPSESSLRDRYLDWSTGEIDMKRNSLWPFDSSRSSLWEITIDNVKQTYLATVSAGYDTLLKSFTGINLSLTPIVELEITDPLQYKNMDPNNSWCARTGYADSFFKGNNFHPLVISNAQSGTYDYCLVKTKFESNTIFRINTQFSPDFSEKRVANWVTSRTAETRVTSKSLGKGKPFLTSFEGSPVAVQAGVTQIPKTQSGFDSYYSGSPHRRAYESGKYPANWLDEFKKNWGIDSDSYGAEGWNGAGWDAIAQWNSTEKFIDPKLTIEQNVWEFSVISLEDPGDTWVSRCRGIMSNGSTFSGVISTNATVFVQGPPRLQGNGELDFQIASTHLKQDGSINTGTYNLSIEESVAQCIWGSSTFGMGASISVVSQEGVTQVATTSMGKSVGQIHFSASGFHFSTNRISVSLGKIAVVNPVVIKPSPSNSPLPASAKKKTIACVSGKVVKKVTALNPKCPTGYKQR